jgi:hypothetical protein
MSVSESQIKKILTINLNFNVAEAGRIAAQISGCVARKVQAGKPLAEAVEECAKSAR